MRVNTPDYNEHRTSRHRTDNQHNRTSSQRHDRFARKGVFSSLNDFLQKRPFFRQTAMMVLQHSMLLMFLPISTIQMNLVTYQHIHHLKETVRVTIVFHNKARFAFNILHAYRMYCSFLVFYAPYFLFACFI